MVIPYCLCSCPIILHQQCTNVTFVQNLDNTHTHNHIHTHTCHTHTHILHTYTLTYMLTQMFTHTTCTHISYMLIHTCSHTYTIHTHAHTHAHIHITPCSHTGSHTRHALDHTMLPHNTHTSHTCSYTHAHTHISCTHTCSYTCLHTHHAMLTHRLTHTSQTHTHHALAYTMLPHIMHTHAHSCSHTSCTCSYTHTHTPRAIVISMERTSFYFEHSSWWPCSSSGSSCTTGPCLCLFMKYVYKVWILGWWNGSVGEDTRHQFWWAEFHLWDPHREGQNQFLQVVSRHPHATITCSHKQ